MLKYSLNGITAIVSVLIKNSTIGAMVNNALDLIAAGVKSSFIASFKASAIAWINPPSLIPAILALFGPGRSWIKAEILRSNSTKTGIKAKIKIKINTILNIISQISLMQTPLIYSYQIPPYDL